MVLKIYGASVSACTKRVGILLYEKDIPFELHEIDWRNNEHKSEAFLEKQPFGQVPYLDDEGFIIYETRAIMRYIAEKYAGQGPALIPGPTADAKTRAKFEQAAAVEVVNFSAHADRAVSEYIRGRLFNLPIDHEKIQQEVKKLKANLAGYERILSKQKYVAGDELTIIDLIHLPYATQIQKVAGSNFIEEFPNVSRWLSELVERDSWKAVKDGVEPILSS